MKLQNLTVIFIIIVLPIILLVSLYINTGLRTIRYQALYDTGLITATQDAIKAFEINTLKNNYSDNAEMKRSIIKSSIKMFETSLCDTCNISSYNVDEIEEYIPAVVFGMSDGFYMYAPSYNPTTKRYEHSLKNYVYYSEMLNKDNAIVIRYYLDSYVHVSGYFDDKYESKEGYLINTGATVFKNKDGNEISAQEFYDNYQRLLKDGDDTTMPSGTIKYYDTRIDIADELAVNYFVDNYKFSDWFNKKVIPNIDITTTGHYYLKIDAYNDPEDPNSEFAQHRNKVIKEKIEGVLNSSITAYSKRTWGQNYKMPKLSEEDWQRIYSDISVTTFFQGKKIGFTKYNGYCVLNSNNHYELINPNLLYFSTDDGGKDSGINVADGAINTSYDYYHDIRCNKIPTEESEHKKEESTGISTVRGWRIGRFQKRIMDLGIDSIYNYERAECACYECINGSISNGTALYDYIKVAGSPTGTAENFIKESYWTSLARERGKLHEDKEKESKIDIEKKVNGKDSVTIRNGETVEYTISIKNNATTTDDVFIQDIFDYNKISVGTIGCTIKKPKTDGTYAEMPYTFETENLMDDSGTQIGIWWNNIGINPGEIITITYDAKIKIPEESVVIGEEIKNTVQVYNISTLKKLANDEAKCIIRGSDLEVKKEIDKENVVYGGTSTYTITIENESNYDEKIDIVDELPVGLILEESTISPKKIDGIKYIYDSSARKISWNQVTIPKNEVITITFKAKVIGNIGETLTNYVKVYVPSDKTTIIKKAEVTSTITKKIKTEMREYAQGYNIVMVLDHSNSMKKAQIESLYSGIHTLLNPLIEEGKENVANNSRITTIHFAANATNKYTAIHGKDAINNMLSNYPTNISSWDAWVDTSYGTNYNAALEAGYNEISNLRTAKPNNKNLLLFFTDGYPTNTEDGGTSLVGYLLKSGDSKENAKYRFRTGIPGISENDGLAIWDSVRKPIAEEIWFTRENSIKTVTDKIRALGDIELYGVVYKFIDNESVLTDIAYGMKKYITKTQNTGPDNNYYKENEDLTTAFKDIGSGFFKPEEPIADITAESTEVPIEKVDKITEIKIGDISYTGTQLQSIKNQIEKDAEGNGILKINETVLDGVYIFKTEEEITIIY